MNPCRRLSPIAAAGIAAALAFWLPISAAPPEADADRAAFKQRVLALHERADDGDAEAIRELHRLRREGRGGRRDYANVFAIRRRAEAGDFEAASEYATALLEGWGGLEPDPEAAAQWYRKAGEMGNVSGLILLVELIEQGRVEDPETDKWLAKLEEIAGQGEVQAQYYYGNLMRKKDRPAKARPFLAEAASNGHGGAARMLMRMHREGDGVEADPEREAFFAQLGARNGDAICLFDLAKLYAEGRGVERDPERALDCMEKLLRAHRGMARRLAAAGGSTATSTSAARGARATAWSSN